jgi:hypothetical protein
MPRARARAGPSGTRQRRPVGSRTAEVEKSEQAELLTTAAPRRQAWHRPNAKAIRAARDFMSPGTRTP